MTFKRYLASFNQRLSLLNWLGQRSQNYRSSTIETLAYDLLVYLGLDANLNYDDFIKLFEDWVHTYGMSGAVNNFMQEAKGISFLRVFQDEYARKIFELFQLLRQPSRFDRMYLWWWWGIRI